jgi:uncharacterized membrane protein YgdD (TMEM256/DUF423 family)
MGRYWLVMGALFGLTSVALGAFGAHGLERVLAQADYEAAQQVRLLDDWEVAARYQMYHALALSVVGVLSSRAPRRSLNIAGGLFSLGVLVFSGCLYLYVLTGAKPWAMIVPLGAVSLMLGWMGLAIGAMRS